jgi:hypothetical protein
MRATPESASSYLNRPSLGSRTTSFLISLAFVLLLLWMLIRMGLLPDMQSRQAQNPLSLIDVQGDRPSQGQEKTIKVSHPHKAPAKAASAPKPKATIPPPKVPPPPIPWIHMSHDDFAQSDISTKPNRAQAQATDGDAQEQSADSGGGSGADNGPGGGPHGEHLYKADWYPRPPTEAEMDFYMSKTHGAEGFGEIACRTAPRYAVVDCEPLGETPGSGYARALVDASWQFHVLPPRINGRPMVGSWVRIHFDFYPKKDPG